MLFLGIDLGSSSVKLAILDGNTGKPIGKATYPETELDIDSPAAGFAEQDPSVWWDSARLCLARLCDTLHIDPKSIDAIGIAYQMHGLVAVDKNQHVLRPAIIWCDSRAIDQGNAAMAALSPEYCFDHLLNSPGNFTAAKLRWVQENQPELFDKIDKIMLPGDYIAMKLSGQVNTTASGLSEGTLWDFKAQRAATELLDHWNIDESILPEITQNLGEQSTVQAAAAESLGLREGIPITYRAGDQPNNAFSLNVLEPGQVAATAGTSGVIYAVSDQLIADKASRVNTFLHVNSTPERSYQGVLACVNGCGRLYSWLRQTLSQAGNEHTYQHLNQIAEQVPVGSDGLIFHPFGNGSERIFPEYNGASQLLGLDFNRHELSHMIRAAQEGIVFALNRGFEVMKELGGHCDLIRVGHGNLFLSDIFAQAFINTTQTPLEIFDTDGAEGAARGAALGAGFYTSEAEAFIGLTRMRSIEPDSDRFDEYQQAYHAWMSAIENVEH